MIRHLPLIENAGSALNEESMPIQDKICPNCKWLNLNIGFR